jgi:hypothetical protein
VGHFYLIGGRVGFGANASRAAVATAGAICFCLVARHPFRQIDLTDPFTELAKGVVGIAIRMLRVRKGLREIGGVVVGKTTLRSTRLRAVLNQKSVAFASARREMFATALTGAT